MNSFPARMPAVLLLVALSACKARDIPRSDAPWITLGASNDVVTSLDTSRIVIEPGTRVVWVRQLTAIRTAPKGAVARMTRAESRHRINCGTRVVTDLEPAGATRPFAEHPHGKRVFATVCNALGNLPANR